MALNNKQKANAHKRAEKQAADIFSKHSTRSPKPVVLRSNVDPIATQIKALHEGISRLLRNTVSDAMEIGKLLAQKKKELPKKFISWFDQSEFDFNIKTAERYMKLHANRKLLEDRDPAGLSEAYKLISDKSESESLPLLLSKFRNGEKLSAGQKRDLRDLLNTSKEKLAARMEEIDEYLSQL